MSEKIVIRGRTVAVDIERELEAYEWNQKAIRGGKLLACSPFRKNGQERHPSFAVRLDNGVWIDSGADDSTLRQGSFVRLLAFLRGELESDTEEYLLMIYDANYADVEALSLDPGLKLGDTYKAITLPSSLLDPFKFRHPYLERRGISEETQRLFHIGYDRDSKAITIPWRNRFGTLINIKFRSVISKKFWYYKDGDRISNNLFGIDLIRTRQITRIFITEAEIDCMYLWTHGLPAVAVGGSNLSPAQRDALIRAGVREIIIATDNDEAGRLVGERIAQELSGYVTVFKLVIPDDCKDVNELSPHKLNQAVNTAITPFPYSFV